MPQLIIIGNSHVGALFRAVQKKLVCSEYALQFIRLGLDKYQPNFTDTNSRDFNATVIEELNTYLAESANTIILAVFAGNAHLAMSITPDPRQPFDFVVPGYESLPNLSGVKMMPYRSVRKALEKRLMLHTLQPLLSLRDCCPTTPICQLDVPPPIADSAYIVSSLKNKDLRAKIDAIPLSPPHYRLKFWLTQSQILRDFCAKETIRFCPVPDNMVDGEGFLAEKAWFSDAVHANEYYGEAVLEKATTLMSGL